MSLPKDLRATAAGDSRPGSVDTGQHPPLADRSDPLPTAELVAEEDQTLEMLAVLQMELLELGDRVDHLAKRLHLEGHSWSAIGGAVGISAQAAHQRWTTKGKASHAERQRRRTHAQDSAVSQPRPRTDGASA